MKKEYLAPEFESVKINGEEFLASSYDSPDETDKPDEPTTPPAEPEDEFTEGTKPEIGGKPSGGIF